MASVIIIRTSSLFITSLQLPYNFPLTAPSASFAFPFAFPANSLAFPFASPIASLTFPFTSPSSLYRSSSNSLFALWPFSPVASLVFSVIVSAVR